MSNHPKIHPLHDPEAQQDDPTSPIIPPSSTRSHGDPSKDPMTQQRFMPLDPTHRRGRSCCCRCVCYTLCFLLLFVVVVAATIGVLYLVFKPKLPDYSINRLQLTRFNLNQDSSLSTIFNVTITAMNPNEHIGIYYEDGSEITVWYKQTKLSNGSLPKFYQGRENKTVIHIKMTGRTQDGSSLITTVLDQQQRTGNIPLKVRVNQPVRVKFGKLTLMEMGFLVKCDVFVDKLAPKNVIKIQSNSCKFKFRL